MILNEDFFDDVEIKDEDLTTEVPAEKPTKEYNEKTSRELIESKLSESEMILKINIFKFHGQYNIWHRIERIMKRLKYMFNIYNINISEPFLMYRSISFGILRYTNFPDNYTIIQHEGCNLYFPEDKLREYGPDKVIMNEELELLVFLDKKLPVFKTARSAYNFAIGWDKCIWKDVTNPKDECFRWCNFYDDDVYNGEGFIRTYLFKNSYVTDDGTLIYKNVLKIVSEEVAGWLDIIKFSKFSDKDIKKTDLENIIKIANQQKIY